MTMLNHAFLSKGWVPVRPKYGKVGLCHQPAPLPILSRLPLCSVVEDAFYGLAVDGYVNEVSINIMNWHTFIMLHKLYPQGFLCV